MDKFQNIIQKQYNDLPKELQAFINAREWIAQTKTIARDVNLTEDDTENLLLEVLGVITLLSSRAELQEALENDPSPVVSNNNAHISSRIDAEVLAPLKAFLDDADTISKDEAAYNSRRQKIATPTMQSTPKTIPNAQQPGTPLQWPAPAPKPAPSFMDDKLSKFVKSPTDSNPTPQIAVPQKPKITPDVRPQSGYQGNDPYREQF